MDEVMLHGQCVSPFSCRVIWATKCKGIPYKYIEEDLSNKSPLLLQYNPVHKTIPVLVHDAKPICESMIILEYLEETWPQNPLLPTDPFERAEARFWMKYAEDKGPTIWMIFRSSSSEEQEKYKEESLENHRRNGAKRREEILWGRSDEPSRLSLWGLHSLGWKLGIIEEGVGAKLLEAQKFPRLHTWIRNFIEVPVIKENLPDREEMVHTYRRYRESLFASS